MKKPSSSGYLVIYSKRSGSKKLFNPEKTIRSFFEKNKIPYDFFDLNYDKGGLKKLDLKKYPFKRLLIVGGDGTVRRVVEYLYNKKIHLSVAIFPTGSANVLAKIIGTPSARSRKNLEYLINPEEKQIPLCRLNKKYIFLIAACFGKIAELSIKAHDHYKHIFGFGSYVSAALKHTLKFPHKAVSVHDYKIPPKDLTAHSALIFHQLAVKKFVPFLDCPEKNLAVILPRNKDLLGFGKLAWQSFLLKKKPEEVHTVTAKKIHLTGDFEGQVHVDGDIVQTKGKKYLVETLKKKISFLVPK